MKVQQNQEKRLMDSLCSGMDNVAKRVIYLKIQYFNDQMIKYTVIGLTIWLMVVAVLGHICFNVPLCSLNYLTDVLFTFHVCYVRRALLFVL